VATEQECLDALRQAAAELDESPSKAQYERLGWQPASATIIRTVGSWNEAKERAELETAPSSGTRTRPPPAEVDVETDEWEAMSVDQRWHYRNREQNARQTLERRDRIRRWLRIHKSSLGCRRCGEADGCCLDFHHVGDQKEDAINKLVRDGYSVAAIRTEMDRCVVLCANCHRKQHVSEDSAAFSVGTSRSLTPAGEWIRPDESEVTLTHQERLRAWTVAYRQYKGCQECVEDDPRSLQFHHTDPTEKSEGVGAMVSQGVPLAAIRSEVGNCVVLCANCHRRRHDEADESR
jgi:hypothetical protein